MLNFYKYQATGNDFVMIDNRNGNFDKENLQIVRKLCDRKFGVGADGLILIENHDKLDFNMIYFNADGTKSFCGNGSKCALSFAKQLGVIENNQADFLSTDGIHTAKIKDNGVSLLMHNVSEVEKGDGYYFINTGSPHYIVFTTNIDAIDIVKEAHRIRYSDRFKEKGTNVNFVEIIPEGIKIRTYERGVEDETLSCGTGVTACALAMNHLNKTNSPIKVLTKGGWQEVSFTLSDNGYENIWLTGPTQCVFEGNITI